MFVTKHLVGNLESYQKMCSLSIPETLSCTLLPAMHTRADKYLKANVSDIVKACLKIRPETRLRATEIYKLFSAAIEEQSGKDC